MKEYPLDAIVGPLLPTIDAYAREQADLAAIKQRPYVKILSKNELTVSQREKYNILQDVYYSHSAICHGCNNLASAVAAYQTIKMVEDRPEAKDLLQLRELTDMPYGLSLDFSKLPVIGETIQAYADYRKSIGLYELVIFDEDKINCTSTNAILHHGENDSVPFAAANSIRSTLKRSIVNDDGDTVKFSKPKLKLLLTDQIWRNRAKQQSQMLAMNAFSTILPEYRYAIWNLRAKCLPFLV